MKKDINHIQSPHEMETLSEVMNTLKKRGIETEFIFEDPDVLKGVDRRYKADDLTLVRTYRFEGNSNPDDNAALYLFEDKEGTAGFVIDIYGGESNLSGNFAEFLKKVPNESK